MRSLNILFARQWRGLLIGMKLSLFLYTLILLIGSKPLTLVTELLQQTKQQMQDNE